jgi:hypothetical protein
MRIHDRSFLTTDRPLVKATPIQINGVMSPLRQLSRFREQRFRSLNLNVQPLEAVQQCWLEVA